MAKQIMKKLTLIIVFLSLLPPHAFADDIYDIRYDIIKKLKKDSVQFEQITKHCTSMGRKRMLDIYETYNAGIAGKIGKDIIRQCPTHVAKLKRSRIRERDADYLSHFMALSSSKTKGIQVLASDKGDYWQLFSCNKGSFWDAPECVQIENNDLRFIQNYIYLDY